MDNPNEKINLLSKEQEAEILLLELSRLRKKGVINLHTYEKTKKEWGL
jgi:hypothetical protein